MQELIKLIEKIDAVISAYITRYGVTEDIIKENGLDDIFGNLNADITHYKKISLAKLEAESDNGFFALVRSLLLKAEDVVRYYTNTDGKKRLATLEWLYAYRELFQHKLKRYKE